MIKICAFSDCHGDLPQIEPCDLVLICGDLIPLNRQGSTQQTYKWYKNIFKSWAEELPCDKVIFIAGNHELHFPHYYERYKLLFPNDSKITYLCNETFVYEDKNGQKLKIFGTPYCKIFGNWAFMKQSHELYNLYNEMPNDIDIMMCHDQPYEYGDILLQTDIPWATGEHIGNIPLRDIILEKQPYMQLSGHLHSVSHDAILINNTIHFNVSLKDERYQTVYSPLYYEFEKRN